MTDEVKTGRLIPYLVEMFRYQAWLGMGKIANPVSGQVERELSVTKAMIDFLAELETRTEGHRSQDETLLLQGTVTDLRLNYMEELKKPEEKPEEAAEEKTPEPADGAETSAEECCGGDGDGDCGCDCDGEADPKS